MIFLPHYQYFVVTQPSGVGFAFVAVCCQVMVRWLVIQHDLESYHPQTGNHTSYVYFATALNKRRWKELPSSWILAWILAAGLIWSHMVLIEVNSFFFKQFK